jgi:ABC-2 type transport system ATP-binding protein
MIEARGLTKRYGETVAVNDLSFSIAPGHVTGFLGPNGAGKTTTMRMILGLDAPTAGTVTVNGRPYTDYRFPLREVGALLDAKAMHGSRRAYDHLLAIAQSNAIPRRRVDEVLEIVGLTDVARRRAGGFSLGMGQRLGIAVALLGDPGILMFDEPVNGLDPEGILWIRNLLHDLADEGRTVFISSHLMSEMALTADRLVVIGRGHLIADAKIEDLLAGGAHSVDLRVSDPAALAHVLRAQGARVTETKDLLNVEGMDGIQIGDLALAQRIAIYESIPQRASLESVFFELTNESVDFHGTESGIVHPRDGDALVTSTSSEGVDHR